MKIVIAAFIINSYLFSESFGQNNAIITNSFPTNSSVLLNNSLQKKTPAFFDSLEMGNYIIEYFLRENYSQVKMIEQYLKTTVTLQSNDSIILNADFSTGEISVNNFKKRAVSKALDYPGLSLFTDDYYEDLGFTLDSINQLQLNDSNWTITSYTFSLEYDTCTSEIECKSNLVTNEVKNALDTAKVNAKKEIKICFKNIISKNLINGFNSEVKSSEFIYKKSKATKSVFIKTIPESNAYIIINGEKTNKKTPQLITNIDDIKNVTIEQLYRGKRVSYVKIDTLNESTYSKSYIYFDSLIIDERVKYYYPAINIFGKMWFLENLNYDDYSNSTIVKTKPKFNSGLNGVFTFGINPGQYKSAPKGYYESIRYNKLYTFKAARSACPEGWRVPSLKEWEDLDIILRKSEEIDLTGLAIIDKLININDNKKELFRVFGGGYYDQNAFYGKDSIAIFWTNTETSRKKAIAVSYSIASDSLKVEEFDKNYAFSVRCIKDE